MAEVIGGIISRDNRVDIDESAVLTPITVQGKPIGFITGVSDKGVGVALWMNDWVINKTEEGKIASIELMDNSSGLISLGEGFSLG